jgi:spermidine synthase
MQRKTPIFLATFILAFCSLLYELLLSQMLSAFLGNTVLRYSITIGLYMLAMGIGAWIAEERFSKTPQKHLLRIEVALTIVGGGMLYVLTLLFGHIPNGIFSAIAHSCIMLIGVLTGVEIPLLMYMGKKRNIPENTVLGVDYIGAFFGGVLFAVLLYPRFGLFVTAAVIAILNGVVGLWIALEQEKRPALMIALLLVALIGLGYALGVNDAVEQWFVSEYTGR